MIKTDALVFMEIDKESNNIRPGFVTFKLRGAEVMLQKALRIVHRITNDYSIVLY